MRFLIRTSDGDTFIITEPGEDSDKLFRKMALAISDAAKRCEALYAVTADTLREDHVVFTNHIVSIRELPEWKYRNIISE